MIFTRDFRVVGDGTTGPGPPTPRGPTPCHGRRAVSVCTTMTNGTPSFVLGCLDLKDREVPEEYWGGSGTWDPRSVDKERNDVFFSSWTNPNLGLYLDFTTPFSPRGWKGWRGVRKSFTPNYALRGPGPRLGGTTVPVVVSRSPEPGAIYGGKTPDTGRKDPDRPQRTRHVPSTPLHRPNWCVSPSVELYRRRGWPSGSTVRWELRTDMSTDGRVVVSSCPALEIQSSTLENRLHSFSRTFMHLRTCLSSVRVQPFPFE